MSISPVGGALVAAGILLLILWLGLMSAAVLAMRAGAKGGLDEARLRRLGQMRIGASACLILGMGLVFLGVFLR